MRHSLTSFILFLIIVFSFGCSNEIDIYQEGDSVPIVYCLLNPESQTQYIRIGKSFSGSLSYTTDSLSPDSIRWLIPTEAYIEKWENNKPVDVIIFEKTDISTRDTGLFPTEGLTVYQAEFKPNSGDEYHLFVYFPGIEKIVSGKTVIMSIPSLLDPEFVPGRTISFDTISPFVLRWSGGSFPGLYQGVFKMNYTEGFGANIEFKSCLFETPIYQKQSAVDIFEEKISGFNFLKSVSEQIKPVDGIKRELINFEFLFYSGGSDLAILVANDLNGSNPFTLSRNVSNISGVFGVFSSIIVQRITNLQPSLTTMYFLATSSYTKDLGFISNVL